MIKQQNPPSNLVLLIGSNPLPNYIAVSVFTPLKIFFVFSGDTIEPKKRLQDVLEQNGYKKDSFEDIFVYDPADAKKIYDTYENKLPEKFHLHYSGGTKPMSSQACLFFYNKCGDRKDASYLDEITGTIRLDDEVGGDNLILDDYDLGLTLDLLLRLHGINNNKKYNRVKPDVQQAKRIFECIKADGTFDGTSEDKKTFDQGIWLEILMEGFIDSLSLQGTNISQDLRCNISEEREFQIDVCVLRGHRLYLISCTQSKDVRVCKLKLFEATIRARQMGGDLARSALVCFLDDNQRDMVQRDLAKVWGQTNQPQVFGLPELKEWASDKKAILKEWLKK
jgi:hypothetical protein